MTPPQAFLDAINTLIASDAATLAPAGPGNKLHLAKANFNPSAVAVPADLTEATFTGSAALVAGTGAQQAFYDPALGKRVIQILEPAGGWHWLCTVLPAPAETIYGYYLTNNAGSVLYGSQLFSTPIVINNAGQGVDIDQARFIMAQQPLT